MRVGLARVLVMLPAHALASWGLAVSGTLLLLVLLRLGRRRRRRAALGLCPWCAATLWPSSYGGHRYVCPNPDCHVAVVVME